MKNYLNMHLNWQNRKLHPVIKGLLITHIPLFFLLFFIFLPGWLVRNSIEISMGLDYQSYLIGVPILAFGFVWYLWTIILFAKARGTQVPMFPTKKLVVKGPYAFTRNPMVISGMFMASGLAVLFNSWSFLLISLIPFVLYLLYIKRIEEKELEHRFGDAYRVYKKNTPFFFPSISGSKDN